MQSPIIHQQLILSIDRIRDFHRSIQAHSSAIPPAEMDVFLAEIRKTYKLALQLHYQNALQLLNEMQYNVVSDLNNLAITQSVVANDETISLKAPSSIEATSTIIVEEMPIQNFDKDISSPVKISAEEKQVIRKEEVSQIPVEVPAPPAMTMDKLMADISKADPAIAPTSKKVKSDVHERFESRATIAHRFEELETLADRIASNPNATSHSDLLHKTPVKDIKASIGLNEKFQFINHLFNGDSEKYHSAVDYLNRCGSVNAAQDFLKNTSSEMNWEKNPAAASVFMDIIERRYLA